MKKKKRLLLTFDQELYLVAIIKRGSDNRPTLAEKHAAEKATEKLIECNQPLVERIASTYLSNLTEKARVQPDTATQLIDAGTKGIRKALTHYNPTSGYKFSTYATWWIRQEMIRYSVHAGWLNPNTAMSNDKFFNDKPQRIIEALSDREKRVIEERMGLTGNKPKPRKEVCEMFAITEERLLCLEEKAKYLLSK